VTAIAAGDRLLDRVALVTGAGGGLGSAIAELFAAQGAIVAVNDRNGDSAEVVARRCREWSPRSEAIVCDVSDPASVIEMFESIGSRWGRLDVLVNNAGVSATSDSQTSSGGTSPLERGIEDITDDHWVRMIGVHLHARRGEDDEGERRRIHCLHVEYRRTVGNGTDPLLRSQGWNPRNDQVAGNQRGARRNTGERRMPRGHRCWHDTRSFAGGPGENHSIHTASATRHRRRHRLRDAISSFRRKRLRDWTMDLAERGPRYSMTKSSL
jgi:NAD(P)-dependent dehydrogenase (short-subunit alcohol dehydrogenase family)